MSRSSPSSQRLTLYIRFLPFLLFSIIFLLFSINWTVDWTICQSDDRDNMVQSTVQLVRWYANQTRRHCCRSAARAPHTGRCAHITSSTDHPPIFETMMTTDHPFFFPWWRDIMRKAFSSQVITVGARVWASQGCFPHYFVNTELLVVASSSSSSSSSCWSSSSLSFLLKVYEAIIFNSFFENAQNPLK